MVRDNRHDSAYIFGAICPARAVGAAVLMPAANAEAMNEHLKEISTQISAGAHAVLVCDGAGWHQRGTQLVVPDNISLMSLPPYSPELNPMENVWDYLRQNQLCAQVWDTYDDILEACKTAWNWLIAGPDRIRSIGARDWARNVSPCWRLIGRPRLREISAGAPSAQKARRNRKTWRLPKPINAAAAPIVIRLSARSIMIRSRVSS
jgi:putative transposase